MSSSLQDTDRLTLAETLLSERKLNDVRVAFAHAEAAGADRDRCCAGRWTAAMLEGRFQAAWRESDTIRRRNAPDPNRYWQGEDLRDARVMVRCLHGLGDAVQMFRYAPLLRDVASQIIFEVPPRLLPLAPFFHEVTEVITWGEHAPVPPPAWDVQIEIMELPYVFRTRVQDLPLASNYLRPPDLQVVAARHAMGEARHGRPRIGLVWAAGGWNPQRSVPLAELQRILEDLEDHTAEFWSLQGDAVAGDGEPLVASGRLRHATRTCGDGLLPLAASIANLDLVITVDTLAAHLAGAMGKPAWVLLEYAADWRWMVQREDSPWYPNTRLFRQPSPGDWRGAVHAVHDALRKFVAGFSPQRSAMAPAA